MSESDVLFIPISKTASTSVREALGGPPHPSLAGHFTAKQARTVLGPKEFDRRWKFCVIRHPLDRLASWFFYNHRVDEDPVRWVERRMNRKLFQRDEMLVKASQAEWITDGEPSLSNPHLGAPDGPLLVDAMLRFSHLEEDWELVCEKVGRSLELPHSNQTRGRIPWPVAINEEAERRARRWWAADWRPPVLEKWAESALMLSDV